MMKLKSQWIVVAVAAVVLTGCGNSLSGSLSNVRFDSSVPADQATLIQGDFATLQQLQFQNNSATEAQQFLGTTSCSPSYLASWLGGRISYVVGQSVDYTQTEQVVSSNAPYTTTVVAESKRGATDDLSNANIVMFNVGSQIYIDGKGSNTLYQFPVAGTVVLINSPLVGIVEIGSGLFQTLVIQGEPSNSVASAIYRLGTYFHEGFHDNGNGQWAAVPHIACNSGYWAGQNACDGMSNGAYPFGGFSEKKMLEGCRGCSNTATQTILDDVSDSYSRVQGTGTVDIHPERRT